MTKKGGVQQLQADISNDEDFEKFLERPGLLVLDVYSEWCGPCLGMVGSLRKVKLEIGGDNLQLGIVCPLAKGKHLSSKFLLTFSLSYINIKCKSDTVSSLKRFTRKSEPTWLFVVNGKAVNIMFGTDVPKLMFMITDELSKTLAKESRTTYDITELQPIELEQLSVKLAAAEVAARIEREAANKARLDYLHYVTDVIMENMSDNGITVFGPQVNRDMFKKLSEPAELLKMQCKDRKVLAVTKDDFATVNFACENPLPAEVLGFLHDKELLMCFWKVDETIEDVTCTLKTYANDLTKETIVAKAESKNGGDEEEPTEQEEEEPQVIPPIIVPMQVEIEVEIEDEEKTEEVVLDVVEVPAAEVVDVCGSEAVVNEEESNAIAVEAINMGIDVQTADDDESKAAVDDIDDATNEDIAIVGTPPDQPLPAVVAKKKLKCRQSIQIPPIWVPSNRRTHAALIYVFFRGQTSGFLPPDPLPEPPHVIMAFDAYKKKDLINVVEKYKDDIPLYGFFSSDVPLEATLLANSVDKYNLRTPLPTDKLVLKVNKTESSTMMTLLSYSPSYMSSNTVAGHDDALKYFPATYVSATQEQEQLHAAETGKPKKRKKNKKAVDAEKNKDNGAQEESPTEEAKKAAKATPEEGAASTSSGEESCESLPPAADGTAGEATNVATESGDNEKAARAT